MKLYQRTGEVVHDLQNMKIGCTSSSRHFSIKKKSSVSPAGHPNKGRRCRGVRGGGGQGKKIERPTSFYETFSEERLQLATWRPDLPPGTGGATPETSDWNSSSFFSCSSQRRVCSTQCGIYCPFIVSTDPDNFIPKKSSFIQMNSLNLLRHFFLHF